MVEICTIGLVHTYYINPFKLEYFKLRASIKQFQKRKKKIIETNRKLVVLSAPI